jgi:hypothetical protein
MLDSFFLSAGFKLIKSGPLSAVVALIFEAPADVLRVEVFLDLDLLTVFRLGALLTVDAVE